MKVITDLKNNLMKRREVSLSLNAETNPGFEGAKKLVGEKFKPQEDLVVITNVLSKFGSNNFLIDALIYDSAESRQAILHKKEVKAFKAAKKEAKK